MLSDEVKVALIASIPPTIAAIGSLIVSLVTHKKVGTVEKGMNGLKTELVDTTRKAAYAEGQKAERDEHGGT